MSLSRLQVQWAETGQIVETTIDIDNCSLDILKTQLSKLVPVAPSDQILLIGPPYKVLDKQYGPSLLHRQSDEKDRRLIFLYDRRVINDEKKPPPTFQLPATTALNDLAVVPVSSSALDALRCDDSGGEARAAALRWCGEFVTEQRRRAGQLAAACGDRVRWVGRSLEQQRGQLGGMEAAVGNLTDIFAAHQREFLRVKRKFEQQQAAHLGLIVNFESNLNTLRRIEVAAPLREAMDRAAAAAATDDAGSANHIHTLYDCIPAERERAYLHLCADTHYKVEETGRRIHGFFDDILGRVGALEVPAAAEQASRACLDVLQETALRLAETEADLQALQERVDALTQGGWSASGWAQVRAALMPLIQAQAQLPTGEAGAAACADMTSTAPATLSLITAKAEEVCGVQTQLAGESYRLLRLVGGLQTEVAHKLKKDIDWMRRWTSSHNEYFSHLEHIADLPQMYSQVLQEIARRNHYNKVFEGEVCLATERIAALRDVETKQREAFMRLCGQHLPPVFFQAIPSLKEKPPFFSPALSDAQPLPDIKIDGLLLRDRESDRDRDRDKASSSSSSGRAGEEESLSLPDSAGRRGLVSVGSLGQSATTTAGPGPAADGPGLGVGPGLGLDALSFRFDQLAYEHARALGDVDSARREIEALRRQLEAKEEIVVQLRRQGERRERGLSLELYASTYPAERLLSDKATSTGPGPGPVSSVSVEVQAGGQQQQDDNEDEEEDEEGAVEAAAESVPAVPLPPGAADVVPAEQLSAVLLVLRDMLAMDKDVQDFFTNNAAAVDADLPTAPQGLLLAALGLHSEEAGAPLPLPLPPPSPQWGDLCSLASEVAVSVARVCRGLAVSVRAPKISFKDFRVGDIMLFIPTSEARKKWLAFHTGAPHRYLSDESVESFRPRGRGGEPRASLLGKVVLIDTFTAAADMNPYGLPLGTEFYVCSAHPVTRDMIASPSPAAALCSSAMQAASSASYIAAAAAADHKGSNS